MSRNLYFLFGSQTLIIFSVVLVVFTIGMVAFNETLSLLSFSQIVICGYVPELIVAPFLGGLIDRYNRGLIILICNFLHFTIFLSLSIFIFLFDFDLVVFSIFIVLLSLVSGVHRVAYNTILSVITDNPLNYPRLNGNIQSGIAIAHIVAPLVAGFMIESSSLFVVICMVTLISLFSMCLMRVVYCPDYVPLSDKKSQPVFGFICGFREIFHNKILYKLLYLHGFFNFARSAAVVVFTPLILSIGSESDLGVLRSIAGIGIGLGALLISKLIIPRPIITRYKICTTSVALCAVFIIFIGVSHNLLVVGVSVFFLFSLTPILAGTANAVWLESVPVGIQGRVFGARDAIVGGGSTAAFVCAPWFAEFFQRSGFCSSMSHSLSLSYVCFGFLLLAVALPQLIRFPRYFSD
ncbi:MFS transporter [Cellvibrio sp. OA-2007]|uniref:MFS transporter n=1 Tax=Cellvibrio sp. OA-2007 TaxID=529823 RepID=UPI000782837A|nr:MFS transporter [Cellvibrio sp. OA-2007]